MLTDLLRRDGEGYPEDYVVARVRGRRARVISGSSDAEIWQGLTRELAWLHREMPPALARTVAPLVALFELKTMVLAILNTAIDRRITVRAVLEHSLLDDSIRAALRTAPDVKAAVAGLVAALARLEAPFGELTRAYADDQLRGFEDALVRVYLERASAQPLHPEVRRFLAAFIDARNVMLLYKQLRWNPPGPEPFVAGGTIAPADFEQALAGGDPAAVDRFVAQVTRRWLPRALVSERALETLLLTSLTRRLDAARRHGDAAGVVLSYVWRLSISARNASLTHHARDVDAATLQRELVP